MTHSNIIISLEKSQWCNLIINFRILRYQGLRWQKIAVSITLLTFGAYIDMVLSSFREILGFLIKNMKEFRKLHKICYSQLLFNVKLNTDVLFNYRWVRSCQIANLRKYQVQVKCIVSRLSRIATINKNNDCFIV